MSSVTKKDYITFSNGLNTETNFIKEEEGTCKEISNFKINKDGSLEKRGGFLPKNSLIKTPLLNERPQFFLWKNVGGVPEDNFYVVKQDMILSFFNASKDFKESSRESFSVNLGVHTTPGYDSSFPLKVQMVDGEGLLFVAGKTIEPLMISFDKEKKEMVAKEIKLLVRDYVGLKDGTKSVEEYPNFFSNSLTYNLVNQGFTESDIAQFYAENASLPAKTDVPKHFKYVKISTDIEDLKKPEEIYDYQLSVENNFGTSKAPIGRKIIDAFKKQRNVGASKVYFRIGMNNLVSMDVGRQETVFTIRTNRVPGVPKNTSFNVKAKQTGFFITFPPLLPKEYSDTMIGYKSDNKEMSAISAGWDWKNKLVPYVKIFDNRDVNWNATPSTSESEYRSHSFRLNNSINVRNTGVNNEYVIVYESSKPVYKDFVKYNLIDNLGGTVVEEFILPWDSLPDNEKGTYLKIVTDAAKDNLIYQRRISSTKVQPNFRYYKTVSTGTSVIEDFTTIKAEGVKCQLRGINNSEDNDTFKVKFISEDLAEITTGSGLKNIDTWYGVRDPLPVGFYDYRFNALKKDGEFIFGLQEIMNQITMEYTINPNDQVVSSGTEAYRPEAITFYANRLFYTSFDSNDYSNHVFFSQLENLKDNVGNCYTKNDPTSEYNSSILATDGGYFTLPEADKILNMTVVKDKLVIFANNGIYIATGDPFFKANSYYVRKATNIGIISKDAFEVVGETVVFASHNGLYNLNIDSQNGDLSSNNFSNERIKTLYNSLTLEQKENIKINYNPFEKKLSIMLNKDSSLKPDAYNTIINYDFDLKAFYEYNLDQHLNFQLVDFFKEYSYNNNKPNSLTVFDNSTGEYGTLIENKNTFKDFSTSNNNFPCTLETNPINFNDVIRNKRVRRLQVYASNEVDSHCNAFIKYDSSIVDSKKWSKSEDIFRLQSKTNGEVHMHQQTCRGEGLFFKLRLENNSDKFCKILGWTFEVEGNQQI